MSRLLISIHDILVELQAQKFMCLEVKKLIEEKRREVLVQVVTNSVWK